MDQRSCDTILKAMLREKQEEDMKLQIRSQERFINRNKTVFRHNKQLKNLENIGVKVRHHSQMKDFEGMLSKDFKLDTTRTAEGSFGLKQRNSTFTTQMDDSSMRMNRDK